MGGGGGEETRGGGEEEERGLKIPNFEVAQCVKASCKVSYTPTLSHSKCPHTHTHTHSEAVPIKAHTPLADPVRSMD